MDDAAKPLTLAVIGDVPYGAVQEATGDDHGRARDIVRRRAPRRAPAGNHRSVLEVTIRTVTPVGNVYDKVAARHPVERRLVSAFSATLASLLPRHADAVLDVGCGEGHNMTVAADRLASALVAGVDVAEPDWLAGWHRNRRPVLVGDAVRLPFADRSVDVVLALEVLEHLEDPRAVMAEMARVCRGIAIISVPWEPVWRAGNLARGRYVANLGNTPGHIQHFTRRGIVRLVESHFDIESVRRPIPWTIMRARARACVR